MIRILFLIRSLEFGGAENQLLELAKNIDQTLFQITIATFYEGGALWKHAERLPSIRLLSLQKKNRWDVITPLLRLLREIRQTKTNIIYGLLDSGNLYAFAAGKLGGAKVIFSLHSADVDFSLYDWTAKAIYRVGGFFSRFADLIIAVSFSGQEHHLRNGYPANKMVVLSNGIDLGRFRPHQKHRKRLRKEWKVVDEEILVGMVARIDPIKDYENFIAAAALAHETRPDLRFICVGGGPKDYANKLGQLSERLNVSSYLYWAGPRQDIAELYSALDIFVLASSSEAFPITLGEAMASALPCIATDVGDVRRILDDCGTIVPRKDSYKLKDAILHIASLSDSLRIKLGKKARKRIRDNYSVKRLATETERMFLQLMK